MCKSIHETDACDCDDCAPPGSMDEMDPCDVAYSTTNGVTTVYTYARHRDCAHCGMRLEDREPGPDCGECVNRKTVDVRLAGDRTIAGLTYYVIFSSTGAGKSYKKWHTCSWTVDQWRKQGLTGKVLARFGGGQCGPATWLYLRDDGKLWRFWERGGRGLRATLLGTVAGGTFTADERLHLLTAEEYRANRRLSLEAAIGRAVFG